TTDASGRFEFAGLATGEERSYAVDARFQGGFFAGRPVRLPPDTQQEPVIEATLRVWETTTDPAAVLIARDDMFAVLGKQGIAIIEAVTIVNQTDMAYIGRGGGSSGEAKASFGFSLPVECRASGVAIVDSDIDIPEIVCTDFGFGITSAIPPGETRTTISYQVPGATSTFDLSRTALYDVSSFSVFAADPLELETNRLEKEEEVTLAGERYERWTSTAPVDPGDALQVVALAKAGTEPGLYIGIAAAIVFLSALLLFALRHRRRAGADDAEPPKGQEVVHAIARLDLAYRNGDLTHHDWSMKRRELKQRLSHPQPD
ncbi:MAG TPA: hypothetical protein VNP73_02965, partial [Actinomycetota bacterium]|nr:hypothetical protein [Actinomycetota bacterium]